VNIIVASPQADGNAADFRLVEGAFGANIDYAMLIKMYEGDSGKRAMAERRYNPATCTGSREQTITGNPDAATSRPATPSART